MSKAIKGGQADRIKQLEQEIQNLKDVKKKNEKLTTDLKNAKDNYHNEKAKRQELEKKKQELELANIELKKIADENANRARELTAEKFAR
jgi:uncharacterized protein YigA (DUF484 family)